MKQQSFTDIEYAMRRRKTKRDEFLRIMDEIIPWDEWVGYIRPFYYKNVNGRPARGIEPMLRMHLLSAWYNLSDEGVEDAIYDSYAFRTFMKLDFMNGSAPDATTLCKLRKIMVDNELDKTLFDAISTALESCGHMMRGGSCIDATIIEAPTSTKNDSGTRDPEMHQTKKGNEWHFGMKTHIGVDAGTGYIHTVVATAANEHDITQAYKLLRDDDEFANGDAGYLGIEKREEIASDPKKSKIKFRINKRPGSIRKMPEGYAKEFEQCLERKKSSVHAKVEYAFLLLKRRFGYCKVRYRGIAKNLSRLFLLFGSANVLMCAWSGKNLQAI